MFLYCPFCHNELYCINPDLPPSMIYYDFGCRSCQFNSFIRVTGGPIDFVMYLDDSYVAYYTWKHKYLNYTCNGNIVCKIYDEYNNLGIDLSDIPAFKSKLGLYRLLA